MSCIRFNTPAQRKQMKAMAPTMLTADGTAAPHPLPPVTESKIVRLRLLASHANAKIRESVASSANTPNDLFATLARDSDDGVRSCIARNESTPADVLRSLVDDASDRVRGFLALNFALPADAMVQLSVDHDDTVRGLVQWRADVTSD